MAGARAWVLLALVLCAAVLRAAPLAAAAVGGDDDDVDAFFGWDSDDEGDEPGAQDSADDAYWRGVKEEEWEANPLGPDDFARYRAEVKEMFEHAYDSYMACVGRAGRRARHD